ncbi:MerR family transcriptional regulator [Halalkalibacillus sediminis]|uniref:MerR family transcriptional regulator n=1 Tax=Halalkalibacillus sediminis TaxID=2018042 RepID=A0A2I0QQR5_9BACI|nr:MerR family transcriptional regulator [Halalkalibacillus sediminis]PKR76674.1 MerR family transcriptional regulator [Halalkalibacillus sediminis]
MYNIKAVANMLDMPTVTIRAWEKRYEAVIPERTESGHRVYTSEHVEDLRWIKRQVDQGVKISQAVELLKQKKAQGESVKESVTTEGQFDAQIQELYDAVIDAQPERIHQLLDFYFSQFHHNEVFFNILAPTMHLVGDEWENNNLSVAHEHMISGIVHQRFQRFFRLFPVNERLPKVLALCPQNEEHQLGLQLFTLFLRENGYHVTYLGAKTPYEGVEDLIEAQGIQIVCFSVTREETHLEAVEFITTLNEINPELEFLIGGSGTEYGEKSKTAIYLSNNPSNWKKWSEDWK